MHDEMDEETKTPNRQTHTIGISPKAALGQGRRKHPQADEITGT